MRHFCYLKTGVLSHLHGSELLMRMKVLESLPILSNNKKKAMVDLSMSQVVTGQVSDEIPAERDGCLKCERGYELHQSETNSSFIKRLSFETDCTAKEKAVGP